MKCTFRPLAWARNNREREQPRGSVILLATGLLVMVLGFAAFTVDVGFITLTKTQMQGAADAAVLAAGLELSRGWGPGAEASWSTIASDGRNAAKEIANAHRSGDLDSQYLNRNRDVRYGRRDWNGSSWEEHWDVSPFNLVQVTLHRDQYYSNTSGSNLSGWYWHDDHWHYYNYVPPTDTALPLFFGPVIGQSHAKLSVKATATLVPGAGFRITGYTKQTADVLPITLDLPTWEALLNGSGSDNYAYNSATGAVTSGSDGILEVNLYPEGTADLPPGNRGTVDLGSSNNSTTDLKRQILYGLNEEDLSYFGGELRTDQGPLYINGDTGLSAGIKSQLEAIIGQPRAIPIFTEVSGPGNNATYTVVKFVGIRILHVKLTGSPSQKHVTIQPAPFVSSTVIRGTGSVTNDGSILAPLFLLR